MSNWGRDNFGPQGQPEIGEEGVNRRRQRQKSRWQKILDGLIVLLVLAVVALFVWAYI